MDTLKGKKKMKKTLALICCLSVLTLAACNTPTATESPQVSAVSESDATASPQSPSMEETVFNTTVNEVISVLDSGVEDYAYILPSDITPTTSDWDAVGKTVAGTYYSYLIYDGVTLNIVDSAQSGKVQSVSLIADISKLTEESSWDFICYKSILVAMFEPDNDRWSSIDTDLNIDSTDFSEDNIYLSSGTVAEYTYTIVGGLATLSIDPK